MGSIFMIIRDFTTNNLELIMDIIIRELIKRDMSYVRVDNELHFDNHIFRFHEKREYENNLVAIPINILESLNEYSNMPEHKYFNVVDNYPKEEYFKITSSPWKTPTPLYHQNKKLIKTQNRFNNRLINTSKK